uniref:Mesothelin a n=1 Tax=Sinocyclocheilus anshuiensis TaxID=1608454 RepID=A0A671N2G4_9TELE
FSSACLVTSLSVSLQIIAVNSSSDAIITNVPDLMATEIPRIFLLDVPQSSAAAQAVNRKKWKHEQVRRASVLQGFTCSRIQSFSTSKVLSLIRGCRRRVNQTLVLQESQLTCMHHYIKSADLSAFSQYPAEVLIYYNYSMIDRSLCRSYFLSLGAADFSVLSSTLSFKKQTLFNHARGCLGISGVSISRDQLDVLGSMSCFLSGEYIQSSDPYVLEKLKPCVDLSAEQISALESVLLGGNTSYGPSDSWNRATLESLDLLPLYLTAIFRNHNNMLISCIIFLKLYLCVFLWSPVETACTVGQILQAQVYSDMFPFAYDVPQFNACLSVQTLKDNLEAVTDRVYDRSYQRIILDKLNQAYPAGLSDEVLQVLGSASHVATPDDVRKWNVTKIDTLSSLMNQRKGDWVPEMVQLLVSKYLSVNGNTLGSNELNALGGTNLCALNTSVLNNITAASVERASALSLTSCSSEKKSILFSIAQNVFNATNTRSTNPISITTYQLLQNYLGNNTHTHTDSRCVSLRAASSLTRGGQ